jgi:hypothetical protein
VASRGETVYHAVTTIARSRRCVPIPSPPLRSKGNHRFRNTILIFRQLASPVRVLVLRATKRLDYAEGATGLLVTSSPSTSRRVRVPAVVDTTSLSK